MDKINRMLFVICCLVCLFFFQSINVVHAQDINFPTKPIEFICSMGAGGTTDAMLRVLSQSVSKTLGQPVVVTNKPGANNSIQMRIIKSAAPDGYTIGNNGGGNLIKPFFDKDPVFKHPDEYTWIMSFTKYILLLLVRDDSPWKNWDDFINWAKKNPNGAKIGVTGAKTVDFKAFDLWQIGKRENAEFTLIAFKGGAAEILTKLLGGHINVFGSSIDATSMSYVREGKLRILAYFTLPKIPGYEDIPVLTEKYDLAYPSSICVFGPRGIPAPVVKKLQDAFRDALKDPEFIQLMKLMEMPIEYLDSAAATKLMNEDYERIAKAVEIFKKEGPKLD